MPGRIAPSARALAFGSLPLPGGALAFDDVPLLMGVINVTPDSFSDGGRFFDPDAAVRRARALAEAGAAVIDIGGESTRPGAEPVSEAEELRRVVPVVRRVAEELGVPVSVDTSKAGVAAEALRAGAAIINDVSALRADAAMAGLAASSGAAVVLMHMLGEPRTMQANPVYADVTREVLDFLIAAAVRAETAGIPRERIIIDPGIGFGKTLDHNLDLLRRLETFTRSGYPVLLGPSRKSFIGALSGAPADERLGGTLACVARAAEAGVRFVRVHDIAQARQCLQVWRRIRPADNLA